MLGFFVMFRSHTNDDVELAGTLVYQSNVDLSISQGNKDLGGNANRLGHTFSDHSNQKAI